MFGYVFHDMEWPKSWANIEDSVVLLERNLYGHPPAGLLGDRQFEEPFFGTWMGDSTDLAMHVRSSKTRVILVKKMWVTAK